MGATKSDSISLDVVGENSLLKWERVLESWANGQFDRDALEALQRDTALGFLVSVLSTNMNPVPYRSVLRVLRTRQQCRANLAVVEYPYLEMEFWDTYAHFHSRSFRRHPKTCWRLHFFSGPESSDVQQLKRGLLLGLSQRVLESRGYTYRGFITIRPIGSFNLGRSAVPFDEEPKGAALSGQDAVGPDVGIARCKGRSSQVANLCSTQLSIDTVPYLQQDPIVGMCATASVWVSSQVLASRFELHKFPFIDITRFATEQPGTGVLPTHANDRLIGRGLRVREICCALSRTGAVPLVVDPVTHPNAPIQHAAGHLHDQLYTYVESELPVIACVTRKNRKVGHAVTCVGHLQPDLRDVSALDGCAVGDVYARCSRQQYLVSQTVTRFYVHNDSYGPFDRLDFLDPKEYPQFRCPVSLQQIASEPFELRAMIVPFPPYVRNRPDTIMRDASRRFAEVFCHDLILEAGYRVLWRCLLTKGSRYKQSLVERSCEPILQQAYATVHLPKYIWLLEFSLVPPDDKEAPLYIGANSSRPIHGEFIYDTTTAHYTTHAIVQRFGNVFILKPRPHMCSRTELARLLEASQLPGLPLDYSLPCFTGSAQGLGPHQ